MSTDISVYRDNVEKAVVLTAAGLAVRERTMEKNRGKYPGNGLLRRGMDLLLRTGLESGGLTGFPDWADESAFFREFLQRPPAEWFDEWTEEVRNSLAPEDLIFGDLDPLCERRCFAPSADCCTLLERCRVRGTEPRGHLEDCVDELQYFRRMRSLGQEGYTSVRRFLIEHPVVTETEACSAVFLLGQTGELLREAYEPLAAPEGCRYFRCPSCGWAMLQRPDGSTVCCTGSCRLPGRPGRDAIPADSGHFRRLKKGIMRFIALPGRGEIQLARKCEEFHLTYELWPEMDIYDLSVQIPGAGDTWWAVDVKAYRHPGQLVRHIREHPFPQGSYAQGFFAVPDELAGSRRYVTQVNSAIRTLQGQEKIKCVTVSSLERQLKKAASASGKEGF